MLNHVTSPSSRRRRSAWRFAAIPVIATTVLIAGCGGGEDSSQADARAPAAVAANIKSSIVAGAVGANSNSPRMGRG